MSIIICDKKKNKLTEKLITILNNAVVPEDAAFDLKTFTALFELDNFIRKEKKNNSRILLEKYIDEKPIFTFLYNQLIKLLLIAETKETIKKPLLLSKIEGFERLDEVAQKLIDDLATIPWKYSVTLFLNDSISETLKTAINGYVDNGFFRVGIVDDSFNAEYPKGLFATSIADSIQKQWGVNTAYIQFKKEGYIARLGQTTTLDSINNSIKSFFGLAISAGLLELKNTPSNNITNLGSYIHIYKSNRLNWVCERNYLLDEPMIKTLKALSISKSVLGKTETNEHLLGIIHLINFSMSKSEKSKKIAKAAQWFFDGYSHSNELHSFVQFMTTLEILLGDKEEAKEIGLGKLLKNRCAYLIANTSGERDLILKEFDEIYETRSNILHNGHSRLTRNEQRHLEKLKIYCSRILRKEIGLLHREWKSTNGLV